jgi:hypothetical protein
MIVVRALERFFENRPELLNSVGLELGTNFEIVVSLNTAPSPSLERVLTGRQIPLRVT